MAESAGTSLCMRSVIAGIKLKFPSVKNITTATLQTWLDETAVASGLGTSLDKKDKRVLIMIDARPEQEHVISHIPSSINIDFETDDMNLAKTLMLQEAGCDSPDTVPANVVLYCSVGYRSSVLADKIQTAIKLDSAYDHWQFFNLEGSIFKWANEGRPMVDHEDKLTNYVHPFNQVWGRLVDKERWKSSP